MAAFQFPDPTVQQTVLNPITGSTYQWKEPPGKWVVTVSVRSVNDIIWEGDLPPAPIGDYKLWYSTDTLELYFHYCDEHGVCAWLPTSVPIQVLEDLNAFAAQAELDIDQLQYKQQLLQNAVDQIYLDVQTGASQRPPIFSTTEPDKHPDFAPPQDELIAGDIWYDTTDADSLEQYIYDGAQWVEFGRQFVHRKGGDAMEGPLELTDTEANLKFGTEGGAIISSTDNKLLEIYTNGIHYKGNIADNEHLITKEYLDDTIDALKTAGDDYYNSLIYVVPTPPTDQMPLTNNEKNHPWTGGAAVDELLFDINGNGDPYHIAFKAPNDLKPYDEDLAIKFTHDSGVMYARIATRWHNGGVHINLKDVSGDIIVDGQETTKIEVQDNIFVKREGDSMTGDLLMQDANIKLNSGSIIFQPIDDPANAGVDGPARFVKLVSKRVRDEDGTLVGGSKDYGIRVDLTEGRSGYNKFQFFSNVDGGDPERFAAFNGGNDPGFLFYRGNFKMEGNRIQKLGTAEVDTDAISLGQVKDELRDFKSEIIEQAAVGVFKWDTQSSNTSPTPGRFFGKQDANNATEPFINNFRVSNEDINGANQDFSTWDVGDIITWTNTINSAYQIRYRVNSVPTFQNGHYFFEVTYISQTNLFVQGNDFILTRQQFTNIDFGDLETTYLRLDCDNSPLVSSDGLEIKTDSERGGGFGEASLTLNGKRDNKNNSVASIKFKNWHYDDSDTVNGYITYRTIGNANGFFRFNKDIDLLSQDVYNVSNLKLTNPGSIWSDTNERIKFKTATAGENGDGLVEFTRPGTNSRRGFAIRGKDTSNADNDIFYTYTNSSGGDAINYLGKQTDNSSNLATTKYVKNYVDNNVTGGATDISISRNSTSVTVQSSSGSNGTINSASSSYAGVMTSSDKSKLDGMSYKIAYRSGNYFIEGA